MDGWGNTGHMADALMFAFHGGDDLWEKARKQYFKTHRQEFVAKTFKNMVKDKYEILAKKGDLKYWQQTLSIFITFVKKKDIGRFTKLVDELAERLQNEENNTQSAAICYLCNSNLNKLVMLCFSLLSVAGVFCSVTNKQKKLKIKIKIG